MGGDSVGLSWDQARYNIRHQENKTYDRTYQALVPEIKNDKDGVVEMKYGTCMWDYAEALKSLSTDLKDVDTNTVINKINKAQENPFENTASVPNNAKLDLSSFLKPKEDTSKDTSTEDTSTEHDKDTSTEDAKETDNTTEDKKPEDEKVDKKTEQVIKALDFLTDDCNWETYTKTGTENLLDTEEIDNAIADAKADKDDDLKAGLETIKKDLRPISNLYVDPDCDEDLPADSQASTLDLKQAKKMLDGDKTYTQVIRYGISNADARDERGEAESESEEEEV